MFADWLLKESRVVANTCTVIYMNSNFPNVVVRIKDSAEIDGIWYEGIEFYENIFYILCLIV